MRKAISDGQMICRTIGWDAFTDDLMHCKLDTFANWERITDADMVDIRVELERRGFKPMSKDLLREVTHASGKINGFDSAQLWLSGLRWDGVERIERFAVDCWGWKDSEYARAVGRYVWTAMAGRVMEPGVRADMAPILVGAQGIKKTSAIQAMVPSEDHYAEVRLDDKDDDISRKLRGKLIGELEELRGLNSRAIEEIKAFVSRRRESWVPKFKEFENFFYRRCILVGSTNDYQFLADPTGERRWLPGECSIIDLDRIYEERDQLWAEGAFVFAMEGVAWADAERLAEREHPRFKISDSWEQVLVKWIEEPDIGGATPLEKGHVTVHEALTRLGIPAAQANRGHELRVAKVLRHIGLREVTIIEAGRSYKGYERA
jgi:predicted P-loop ATPase